VLVVDTSAVIAAVIARPFASEIDARMRADGDLKAPHLIDIEFLHALRRLVRRRVISDVRAVAARRDFEDLAIERFPHQLLADRIWELRTNLSAYDAAFVALGEELEVPVVTCDQRLAGAPHRARIETFRA